MKAKLTELSVNRRQPPATGRLDIWDTTLPAFGLRITAAGSRSYVVAIRKLGAKHPSRIKIGEPGKVSLADARTRARQIMQGGELAPAAPAVTFGMIAERFLKHSRTKGGRPLRPATVRAYERALLIHARHLHDRPLAEIRRADAAALIQQTATNSGATSAGRVRAALSRLYTWAIASGAAEANPFLGTEGYQTGERERVLSDPEIRALWQATAEPADFATVVRLLLWTGARRGEVGGMRWPELADGVWTVPGTRTKNHSTLALPLPRQALAALDRVPQFVGRDFVFGRGPNGFADWARSKKLLENKLNFSNSWKLHDLRRTVQTKFAELEISRDVANKVLNHAMGKIDRTYDRFDYFKAKQTALQQWADELDRLCS